MQPSASTASGIAFQAGELKCVDLEARFPEYKIGYEDPAFRAHRNPYHKIIICKNGHICPSGGDELWACTDGRRSKIAQWMVATDLLQPFEGNYDSPEAKQICEGLGKIAIEIAEGKRQLLPCEIKQIGSDGINAAFDVKDAALFLKAMGAKRS